MEMPEYIDETSSSHPPQQQHKHQITSSQADDDDDDDDHPDDHQLDSSNGGDNNTGIGGNVDKEQSFKILDGNESDMELMYQQQEIESAAELGRLYTTQSSVESTSKQTMNLGALQSTQDIATSKWSQCQFCKLVITTVNLWRHIRTQHTAQPPRQCEHCNKKFKNKYSLREHVRISHEQKIITKPETKMLIGNSVNNSKIAY